MTISIKLTLVTTICLFSFVSCLSNSSLDKPATTFESLSIQSFTENELQRQWQAQQASFNKNILSLEHFKLSDAQDIVLEAQALHLPLTFGQDWQGAYIQLIHPEFQLSADIFTYNETQNTAIFNKNVMLEQNDIILHAELLNYYTKDNHFVFEEAQGVVHHD